MYSLTNPLSKIKGKVFYFKLIYKEYDNSHFQREYGGVLVGS